MSFHGELLLRHIEGPNFEVCQKHSDPKDTFAYTTCSGLVIVPKEGAWVNGASVPRLFWRLLPRFGTKRLNYFPASVIHDWLYHSKQLDRKESDLIFLEAMLDLNVYKIVAHTMYWAVRIGGRRAWRKA